jgi:hypothetical protein
MPPEIILTCFFSLQGEVSSPLRAVYLDATPLRLQLYFYYDGKISKEDEASAASVAQNVSTAFPSYLFEYEMMRIDYPFPVLKKGIPIYQRKEPHLAKEIEERRPNFNDLSPSYRISTFLNVISALIGNVLPSLKCLKLEWVGTTPSLYFYYDSEYSYENYTATQAIMELIQDDIEFHILKSHSNLEKDLQTIYYRRD